MKKVWIVDRHITNESQENFTFLEINSLMQCGWVSGCPDSGYAASIPTVDREEDGEIVDAKYLDSYKRLHEAFAAIENAQSDPDFKPIDGAL